MFKWFFRTDRKTASDPPAPQAGRVSGSGTDESGSAPSSAIHVALQHHQAGRLAEADAVYHEVLARDPDNCDALHLSGVVAFQIGQHEVAAERISGALRCNPSNAAAHNNLGAVFKAQDKLDDAVTCFKNALALEPDYADAHSNLGAALKAQGNLDGATACYEKVVSLTPDSAMGHFNLGNVRDAQGNRAAAIHCYTRALMLRPDFFEAQFNLGNVLKDQGQLAEAVDCYRKALALKPDSGIAYINLANALKDQGRFDEAADCYKKALIFNPESPTAHFNFGQLLRDQGKLEEAVSCYQKAISLKPDFPEAHFSLGHVFWNQGKVGEAIGCYQTALIHKPDYPEAHFNLGQALNAEGDMDGAVGCYQKAISLKPDYAEARWALVMSHIPAIYEADADAGRARTVFSGELGELERWFDSTRPGEGFQAVGVLQPFLLAYHEEDNRELLRRYGSLCTRTMSDWFDRQSFSARKKRESDGVVRVGVVSQHFFNHSVWNAIIKGWFQHLDRERFSLRAFHVGMQEDQETRLAGANCALFVQGHRDLRQWAEAIISQDVDVLIYPEIGMNPMTVKLASLRLAPVQVAGWGHPETTGLPTIDYYLSAEGLEPRNAQDNYTERLIALSHLGCFYDRFPVSAAGPDLHGSRIDPDVPLLLCPGVPFKYMPQHDWVLTEIAHRLGRCRFVFFTHQRGKLSRKLRQRLEMALARRNLNMDEFVTFVPWQDSPGFHGWLKRATVYLDTIGFSGFNTAMQGMACGVPIVTMEGRFMRGRLGSGILKRTGLQELVASTEEEYVALAVRLSKDKEYREHIRERIEGSRHLLFEDYAPIRDLENFLAEATKRR